MKKKLSIYLVIIFTLIIIITTIIFFNKNKIIKPFYLEKNYYNYNDMLEISIDELNNLIDTKKSFVVFVYQPMCITSSAFENILNEFLEENNIRIFKIAFNNIKNTNIGKHIKYYPSFIIYNEGKIIDYLEADKDKDIPYYTSNEEFKKWFTKYVKLTNNYNENKMSNDKPLKEDTNILNEINLENVLKEDDKINIYFFWGDGCSHCEEEFEFFESIKEKYGNYYNLYTFETWYNEENRKLAFKFAENMNDIITGVPYTIIGNNSFIGFKKKYKEELINIIETQHTNSYDVYFDKIKK